MRTQTDLQGAAGLAWLSRLPEIVDACARRWNLTVAGMMAPLTYNFLVSALLQNRRPVVLKICPPDGEFTSQRAALAHLAGSGVVELLDSDETDNVLLLERCLPGHSLRARTDGEAIEIAGSLMRRLWASGPADSDFPSLADWGRGFARLRRHFQGTGPFPVALVERAERTFSAFSPTAENVVLLHGDLHHDNILAAERQPWLAIDPKGVLGIAAYEPATFVINQTAEALAATDLRRFLTRRVDGLAESAGLDRTEVREWAVAHAVLSAWWTVEDHGRIDEFTLACASALACD
ncbi:MAG TPA: aminoglycoside phosphotransferase family protein [Nitrolancea sp.]|nr:aminoglycoside phosphotransferase family protein [Nitrolancea sp.]